MAKENKIKYGLKNVYRASVSEQENGTVEYGTPVPMKGAVTISVSPEITRTAIAADDNPEYAVVVEDNGYSGDIEFQCLSDSDRAELLGSTVNSDGVLIENKDDTPKPVALLFEFCGDVHKTRHVLYNCLCTKPSVESETGRANKTDKLSITARPAVDTGHVKAKVTESETQSEAYNSWFDAVYVPADREE